MIKLILIFFIAGVAALLYGIGILISTLKWKKNVLPARGEVTGIKSRRIGDTTFYYATIRFVTHAGQACEFESSTAGRQETVGKKVDLFYQASNPSQAKTAQEIAELNWKHVIIAFVISFLCFAIYVLTINSRFWLLDTVDKNVQ